MPEQIIDNRAESGWEASLDALLTLSKKLWLSPEIVDQISKLSASKKEECLSSLEDIIAEAREKNIGNADRDKKVNETLASEFRIFTSASTKLEVVPKDSWYSNDVRLFKEQRNLEDLKMKELERHLTTVKELDTTIVAEEPTYYNPPNSAFAY